jgi:Rps23 Pro-64 3,4-dihydroxylase Tpa1-like proline 4-hydroxylase
LAELNWTWWRIGDGAFFTEHKDIAVEDNKFGVRRIITAVYYFHRLPKAFSGGVLRIYPPRWQQKLHRLCRYRANQRPRAGSKIRALQ